jgi:hypothetical protein
MCGKHFPNMDKSEWLTGQIASEIMSTHCQVLHTKYHRKKMDQIL